MYLDIDSIDVQDVINILFKYMSNKQLVIQFNYVIYLQLIQCLYNYAWDAIKEWYRKVMFCKILDYKRT